MAGRIKAMGRRHLGPFGLQPGYYKAYVDIDTGSGDDACQAFSSTSVLVKRCPPLLPRVPNVGIVCPERVVRGERLILVQRYRWFT